MIRRTTLFAAALFVASAGLIACDTFGTNEEDAGPLKVITVEDLPADPATSSDGGRPQGTGRYTFYDLRDSTTVLRYDAENRSDSASTEWDIGLRSTDIIVNGGSKGPGSGAAYVATAAFQNLTEVETDSLNSHVIEDWFTYNANGNHIVRPTPGRTIVVRTADGEAYAKIRILSYYKGNPDSLAQSDAPPRYYTFEYALQDEGTSFE